MVKKESASKHLNETIKRGLTDYLSQLKKSFEASDFPQDLTVKALSILKTHEQIVERLKKPKFIQLLEKERELKGDAKLGYIMCVDGRLSSIHFGRTVNIWEEPAGLLGIGKDENGNLILTSKTLTESLQREAEEQREVFEIFFAHTSLRTDHICGYMAGLRQEGETDDQLVKRNLQEIEEKGIPAFTNTYNKARSATLKQVAVSAVFDTDTMGIVLNYGKENQLSTADLLEKEQFKDKIQNSLTGEENLFGFWKGKFTDPKKFFQFYQKTVEVTEKILTDDSIGLNKRLRDYIQENYPDLTEKQQKAFMFSLSRRLAFQYLTGLSFVSKDIEGRYHPDHLFADHHERFATISTSGEGVLDRFNVSGQSFGITSSDKKSAVFQAEKVALPLLDRYDDREKHIIFVSTPIGNDDDKNSKLEENRKYFQALLDTEEVKKRIREGKLLLIPVLVKTTGEIIEIPQHLKN